MVEAVGSFLRFAAPNDPNQITETGSISGEERLDSDTRIQTSDNIEMIER